MINLASESMLAKWFVWSCDHLPFTVTRIYSGEDDSSGVRRKGASYVAGGTTLCHIFWAVLWVPVAIAAVGSLLILGLAAVHIGAHNDFIRAHPDVGPIANVAAYFFPEAVMLGCATGAGIIVLSIIGGSKTGFFMLLWQYLKGMKQRVCPLVHFDGCRSLNASRAIE